MDCDVSIFTTCLMKYLPTLAVTYVDDLIGQILDALVQSDLADNTIVTLIGDHGWTLGENRVSSPHPFFNPNSYYKERYTLGQEPSF